MRLSFLPTGATCRTHVYATIQNGKIVTSSGRELSFYEWKILRYQVEESSICEYNAVRAWIRSWRNPHAKPMLLTDFDGFNAVYPIWCERKYDGHRCIIVVDEAGRGCAYSREGKPIPAAQALADVIAQCSMPGVFDGEIDAGTWSKTQSAVKSGTGAGLRFYAWDHLGLTEWRAGRSERPLEARRHGLDHLRDLPGVAAVESRLMMTDADLEAAFNDAIAQGHEGLVIKKPGSLYTCGVRSDAWQKLKPCREDSCESE